MQHKAAECSVSSLTPGSVARRSRRGPNGATIAALVVVASGRLDWMPSSTDLSHPRPSLGEEPPEVRKNALDDGVRRGAAPRTVQLMRHDT